MGTIVITDAGPRSSCCGGLIKVQKEYTDTHDFTVDSVETDPAGKIVFAEYSFVRTYDGMDGENFRVFCGECDKPIDSEGIDWQEG